MRDINSVLDRIEHLMNGVRHVSDAIAHDLRTPLGRIRSRLEEALRPGGGEMEFVIPRKRESRAGETTAVAVSSL
jgi:signal transduction histidine kinase